MITISWSEPAKIDYWNNISPCGCYTFPKKDSTYTKKDTLKPTKDFTFVRKKEKKKYFRA